MGRAYWPHGAKSLMSLIIWNDSLVKLTKLTFTSVYVLLSSSSVDCFSSVRLLKKNDAGITGIYEIKHKHENM